MNLGEPLEELVVELEDADLNPDPDPEEEDATPVPGIQPDVR